MLFRALWMNSSSFMDQATRTRRVPSLVWFCLQVLSEFPDQVNLPAKLTYGPSLHPPPTSFTLIDQLFRSFSADNDEDGDAEALAKEDDVDLTGIDPRMWATVVQIFDRVPPRLRTYTLPFNNVHLSLLQTIQNSTSFSLITILELPGWKHLTDDDMYDLRSLHTLAALDLSNTSVSANGFSILARGLDISRPEDPLRQIQGPWGLRIIRTKHCRNIENNIYEVLEKFPLLSIVDLRGTRCHPGAMPKDFSFLPSSNRAFFTSMMIFSLNALQRLTPQVQLFSAPSQYQFYLRVKTIRDYSAREPPSTSPESGTERALSETKDSYTKDRVQYSYMDSNADLLHAKPKNKYDDNPDRTIGDCSREDGEVVLDGCTKPEDMVPPRSSNPHSSLEPPSKRFRSSTDLHLASRTPGPKDSDSCMDERQRHSSVIGPTTGAQKNTSVLGNSITAHSDKVDLPETVPHRRTKSRFTDTQTKKRLYSYDADRFRQSCYVPLSRPDQEFDDQLTLFRYPRPWSLLEAEFECLKTQETLRREPKDLQHIRIGVGQTKEKAATAISKLQTMTMAAIQRRRSSLQDQPTPLRQLLPSRNPFAKTTSVAVTQPRSSKKPSRLITATPRILKPISTLDIPTLPNGLWKSDLSGEHTQPNVSEASSNRTKTDDTSPKQRLDSSSSPQILNAATKSANLLSSSQSKRKKLEKEAQKGTKFDWKAWASKT